MFVYYEKEANRVHTHQPPRVMELTSLLCACVDVEILQSDWLIVALAGQARAYKRVWTRITTFSRFIDINMQ